MKPLHDLMHRRQTLTAQIESQRLELGQAYRQLEKPILVGEKALQGFGFLRKNPWVAAAAPGFTSLLFSGFGALMKRGKPKSAPPIDREQLLKVLQGEEVKSKKPLRKLLGYGVTAFQLYRKVRPFFP